MYIDFGSLCLSLAFICLIFMLLGFLKAFVDVYLLKKCDCEKDWDGSCLGFNHEKY